MFAVLCDLSSCFVTKFTDKHGSAKSPLCKNLHFVCYHSYWGGNVYYWCYHYYYDYGQRVLIMLKISVCCSDVEFTDPCAMKQVLMPLREPCCHIKMNECPPMRPDCFKDHACLLIFCLLSSAIVNKHIHLHLLLLNSEQQNIAL